MRPTARILFLLVLGCSIALPVSLSLARDPGRDDSRCIHACNVVRQNCEDRCDSDCAALDPGDGPERRACESTCHGICLAQEKDCKAVCLAFKKGDMSTPEP